MAMRSCDLCMVSMDNIDHEEALPMDGNPPDLKNNINVFSSLGSSGNNLATGIGGDKERFVYGPGFLVITSSGFEGNQPVGGIGLKFESYGVGRDVEVVGSKPYWQAEEDALTVDYAHGVVDIFSAYDVLLGHNSRCDNDKSDGVGQDLYDDVLLSHNSGCDNDKPYL
ncbi:hypothetical protein AMTR_s00110p00027220 [Amborella trichopoda]|uniref:Uncharacterized protein n=1 Tax=Amborella trichopoda TaxID=13333 RepID=W1NW88_AMBTC|nr:hypothetical protein AMTR_s00110p00027220 [Amborella trichopoda]